MVISGISKQMESFLRGREVQILHVCCLRMDSSPPYDPGLLEVTPRSCCRREFGVYLTNLDQPAQVYQQALASFLSPSSLPVATSPWFYQGLLLSPTPRPPFFSFWLKEFQEPVSQLQALFYSGFNNVLYDYQLSSSFPILKYFISYHGIVTFGNEVSALLLFFYNESQKIMWAACEGRRAFLSSC